MNHDAISVQLCLSAGLSEHKTNTLLNRLAMQRSSTVANLLGALHKIFEWNTPKVISHGELVPMAVAYGSNGERDYFRGIARVAIEDATEAQSVATSVYVTTTLDYPKPEDASDLSERIVVVDGVEYTVAQIRAALEHSPTQLADSRAQNADDGAALRLAAELNISVKIQYGRLTAKCGSRSALVKFAETGGDRAAAMRLAINRIADALRKNAPEGTEGQP